MTVHGVANAGLAQAATFGFICASALHGGAAGTGSGAGAEEPAGSGDTGVDVDWPTGSAVPNDLNTGCTAGGDVAAGLGGAAALVGEAARASEAGAKGPVRTTCTAGGTTVAETVSASARQTWSGERWSDTAVSCGSGADLE